MNFGPKKIVTFLLGLFFFIGCKPQKSNILEAVENSEGEIELDQELHDISRIDTLHYTALNRPMIAAQMKSKPETNQIKIPEYETLEMQIRQYYISNKIPSVKVHAAYKFIDLHSNLTMKNLRAEEFSEQLAIITECETALSCYQGITSISLLTATQPELSLDAINTLIDSIWGKTEPFMLGYSLAGKALLYLADSVKLSAMVHVDRPTIRQTRYGMNPYSPVSAKPIEEHFQEMERTYKELYIIDNQSQHETELSYKVRSSLIKKETLEAITNEIQEFDQKTPNSKRYANLIAELYENAPSYRQASLVHLMYRERMANKDVEAWLDHITNKMYSDYNPSLVYLTLATFYSIEVKIPSRVKWYNALTMIGRIVDPDDQYGFRKEAENQLQATNIEIAALLHKLSVDSVDNFVVNPQFKNLIPIQNRQRNYMNVLIHHEQELADQFKLFQSILFQGIHINHKIQKWGTYQKRAEHIRNGKKDPDFSEEDIENKIADMNASIMQSYFTILCYGEYGVVRSKELFGGNRLRRKTLINVAGLSPKSEYYRIKDFCPEWDSRGAEFAAIKGISNLNRQRSNREIAKILIFDSANILASVFLVVKAAQISAQVGMFVKTAVLDRMKIAVGTQIEGALARMAAFEMTPYLASVGAMSAAFLFASTTGSYALAMGEMEVYDKNKTLWDNYGNHLMMGAAIIMALPLIHKIAGKAVKPLFDKPFLKNHHFRRDLAERFYFAGIDTVLFTGLDAGARTISMLQGKQDHVYKDWEEFFESAAHSAMIGLAFRIKHKHSLIYR